MLPVRVAARSVDRVAEAPVAVRKTDRLRDDMATSWLARDECLTSTPGVQRIEGDKRRGGGRYGGDR